MEEYKERNNVFLYINYTCNIKCKACYFEKCNKNKDVEDIKKEIELLGKVRDFYSVILLGGEPTLNPNLNRIIQYLTSIGKQVTLLTNGMNLTKEKLIHYKTHGLKNIILHIDSEQERSDLDCSVNELRNEIGKRVSDLGIGCSLNIILYKDNLEILKDEIDFVLGSKYFKDLIVNCETYCFEKEKTLRLEKVMKYMESLNYYPDLFVPSNLSNKPRWLIYLVGESQLHFEQLGELGNELEYCKNCPDLTVHNGQIRPGCLAIDGIDNKHFDGVKWNTQL